MRFSKMHGLGNDFMVVDAVTQDVIFSENIIRYLSNRRLGVGFDQLLLVEPPYFSDEDFHYRIFNSNGKEVYQCGNGIRCFARFVYTKKLTNKSVIYVSTCTRRMKLFIIGDEVRVDMGEPNFDPKQVPFCSISGLQQDSYLICIDNKEVPCGVVSVGNPHCVLIVGDIETAQVSVLGPLLANHCLFPDGANISFMEIVNSKRIRLRVYERDVGETQSCGSAACAAVSVGIRQGFLFSDVQVDLLGGSLMIHWEGIGYSLYMQGPATHVYDGHISINM